MKRTHIRLVQLLAVLTFNLTVFFSQAQHAQIGFKAPPIQVSKWLYGNPVPDFVRGKIYVVEFTTWGCPACNKIIPNLTRIQESYGDRGVTVVSIYVNPVPYKDQDKRKEEDLETHVKQMEVYVEKLKGYYVNRMAFSIAVDHPYTLTRNLWGRNMGTPTLFLIDGEGTVVWRGVGVDGAEDLEGYVLESLLGDSFDYKKEYADQLAFYGSIESLNSLIADGDIDLAKSIIDSLIEVYPKRWNLYREKLEVLLAASDKNELELYVYWMLNNMPENFAWDKIAPALANDAPDLDVEIIESIADRNISTAETTGALASKIAEKANSYYALFRTRQYPEYLIRYIELYNVAISIQRGLGKDDIVSIWERDIEDVKLRYSGLLLKLGSGYSEKE